MHFGVVIEINKYVAGPGRRLLIRSERRLFRLFSLTPMLDPIRPPIEFRFAVTAYVKLLGAVQTTIDKIGSDILGERPFARGVGDDKRNVVPAKKREELRNHEGRMSDFNTVANRPRSVGRRPLAPCHFVVVLFRQLRGRTRIPRKQFEEFGKTIRVPTKVRRKLPEDRA